MDNYKITSELVEGHALGETVSAFDFEFCNIAALVEAGHLAPTKKTDKE